MRCMLPKFQLLVFFVSHPCFFVEVEDIIAVNTPHQLCIFLFFDSIFLVIIILILRQISIAAGFACLIISLPSNATGTVTGSVIDHRCTARLCSLCEVLLQQVVLVRNSSLAAHLDPVGPATFLSTLFTPSCTFFGHLRSCLILKDALRVRRSALDITRGSRSRSFTIPLVGGFVLGVIVHLDPAEDHDG